MCRSRRNVDCKSLKNGSAKGEAHTAADMAEMHLKCKKEKQSECNSSKQGNKQKQQSKQHQQEKQQKLKQHGNKGKEKRRHEKIGIKKAAASTHLQNGCKIPTTRFTTVTAKKNSNKARGIYKKNQKCIPEKKECPVKKEIEFATSTVAALK